MRFELSNSGWFANVVRESIPKYWGSNSKSPFTISFCAGTDYLEMVIRTDAATVWYYSNHQICTETWKYIILPTCISVQLQDYTWCHFWYNAWLYNLCLVYGIVAKHAHSVVTCSEVYNLLEVTQHLSVVAYATISYNKLCITHKCISWSFEINLFWVYRIELSEMLHCRISK